MIFQMEGRKYESEKERNFYSKFFLGYFFNELIDGYEQRLKFFSELLGRSQLMGERNEMGSVELSAHSTFVSIDNHNYPEKGSQEGEFADVMIHDVSNGTLVAIEVKFLDDWDFNRDIKKNGEKIVAAGKRLRVAHAIPCLLLTGKKWKGTVTRKKQTGSNYAKLLKCEAPPVILTWEDFLEGVTNQKVREFVAFQLGRRAGTSPFI